MSADFSTGWFANGERAWHGEGVVTEGTLPAKEAFETANALFTVEKRELQLPTHVEDTNADGYLPGRVVYQPTGSYGLVRTDTQTLLGIVTQQYEIVQNDALLRMAEFIREEVEMDTVVVLKEGARVAFTAKIKGAEAHVRPNDPVYSRIVGYLGHDGKSGCGAIFTNVRVVCSNTMAAAERSSNQVSIRHKNGANANFERLITSIDCARRNFQDDVALMDAMANIEIDYDTFRDYLECVYSKQLAKPIVEKTGERPRQLEDLRIFPHIKRAYNHGFGANPGSLWGALNAVTEVETSTKRGNQNKRFYSSNFGLGYEMSRAAVTEAHKRVLTMA